MRMINKKFFFVLFFVFIFGCADFEFVYKNPEDLKNIQKRTELSVVGDEYEIVASYARKKIGKPFDEPTFKLTINSQKQVVASVIEKDATASKFNVLFNLNYVLINIKENCIIFEDNVSTEFSYDSKSEGYSFGTDMAEKEASQKNIQLNIEKFLNNLDIMAINLACNNEN